MDPNDHAELQARGRPFRFLSSVSSFGTEIRSPKVLAASEYDIVLWAITARIDKFGDLQSNVIIREACEFVRDQGGWSGGRGVRGSRDGHH